MRLAELLNFIESTIKNAATTNTVFAISNFNTAQGGGWLYCVAQGSVELMLLIVMPQ